MAEFHARAQVEVFRDRYEKEFHTSYTFDSLMFHFLQYVNFKPVNQSVRHMEQQLSAFRQQFYHKYLHHTQDASGLAFVKAMADFTEKASKKKADYVQHIGELYSHWRGQCPGGHYNGELVMFRPHTQIVSEWCADEVNAIAPSNQCLVCTSKKRLTRCKFQDDAPSCPANLYTICQQCLKDGKTPGDTMKTKMAPYMLHINPMVDTMVQQLASLPVAFLKGVYANENYDAQTAFSTGVETALGSVNDTLSNAQRHRDIAREQCAKLDDQNRGLREQLRDAETSHRRMVDQLKQAHYRMGDMQSRINTMSHYQRVDNQRSMYRRYDPRF